MTAGFQYPKNFAKNLVLVGYQIQNTVAHNYISLVGGNGDVVNVSQPESYIVETNFFCIAAGFFNHSLTKINAYNFTFFAYRFAGYKSIVAGTATQVYYRLAFFNLSKRSLISLNEAYNVKEFIADIIIFGSDGGEEAYAFDISGQQLQIVKLPFIGMGYVEKEKLADKFMYQQIDEKKSIFKRMFG